MKILIVHGTTSRPERSWFPWLTYQMLKARQETYVPRLPTPHGQTYVSWKEAFERQTPPLDEQTILVGHSTGCLFLLRYLSERTAGPRVAGLILASSFVQRLSLPTYPELETILNDFVVTNLDWPKLRAMSAARFCFHGDNDPYVPVAFGQEVAGQLHAPMTLIRGGLHLNSEAGQFEFPELHACLNTLLN